MTFDETIENFEQEANNFSGLVPMEIIYEIILDLRDEYAHRVKMTKKDAEKWDKFYKAYYGVKFRIALERLETDNRYIDFYRRFAYNSESVAIFAKMFAEYNPDNPEKTIEIVPDMKWFVRSKEVQSEDDYFYLINPGQLFPLFTTNIERAGSFSTKEEAEHWTNPLTEAVQLPVEEIIK